MEVFEQWHNKIRFLIWNDHSGNYGVNFNGKAKDDRSGNKSEVYSSPGKMCKDLKTDIGSRNSKVINDTKRYYNNRKIGFPE